LTIGGFLFALTLCIQFYSFTWCFYFYNTSVCTCIFFCGTDWFLFWCLTSSDKTFKEKGCDDILLSGFELKLSQKRSGYLRKKQ